jgi:transient receptor potential cation channel subfamily M member 3
LTPYPFHRDKEELPSEYANLSGIVTLALRPSLRKLTLAELLEVPLVKAYTHGATRVLFAIFYAYLLVSDQISKARTVYSVILLAWTTGFVMIEVLQYQKDGLKAYLGSHVNWLDVTYLSMLMGCLFLSWVFEEDSYENTKRIVQVCLSFNFIPVALRTLTVFKLSPFLGGLLFQLYYLAKDCITFFFLLSLFYLTMAVSLDPILFTSREAQEHQGLFWPYYVIGGSVDSKAQTASNSLPSPLSNISSTMLYGTIFISNVLLINLLIAIMSNTYGTNAARTAENWATSMIETVLEFDDLPALPPPFNLLPLIGDALWLPRAICNPLDISEMEWDVSRPSTWRRKDMIAAKQRVREAMLRAKT